MKYVISVCQVSESYLAVVQTTVNHQNLGATIRQILASNKVYQFVAAAGIAKTGHNVIVYNTQEVQGAGNQHQKFVIEVGVQIASTFSFESNAEVVCSLTPQGSAATTIHTGPYEQLGQAHNAILGWAREYNQPLTGLCWEVYGDWQADTNKLTTEVFYLLK